jgi:parallel beta-helix repeat protein
LGESSVKRTISRIVLTLVSVAVLILAYDAHLAISAANLAQTKSTNSIVLQFDFPAPLVTENLGYDSIAMLKLPQFGAPGEPILPFKMVKALIPQDKDVQHIDVINGNKKVLEGRFNVEFGKTPIPISSNVTMVDQPNEVIYSSANPFPSELFSQVSEQYLRGCKVLLLKLYPAQYVPKTGEISYFETMTVTITLCKSSRESSLFRNLPSDKTLVSEMVDNPTELDAYTKTDKLLQDNTQASSMSSYDYVIITSNALKSSFQPLTNWKIQKGLTATMVLVEDIMKNPKYNCNGLFGDGNGSPKFNDTQAHIRNFIKDAYLNWSTEYVLLGGDDETISARGVYDYAGIYTDYNIPCDLYYGALDRSWDNDNDTIFGETVYKWQGPENGTAGEEADFLAEVYIGRATVDTPQEATNFVTKTITYEQSSQASYLKKALMIGQTADDITAGGNGKDLVTDIIPQYTTTRLYSRDGTFSRIAVITEMNSGTHIVNHEGHSNYLSVMGLSRTDVDSLINTEYFLAYSLGCYSAAFDEATSGSGEAIGEHFICGSHGAFAYVGNSRYGWYCPGITDGPGELYDRSFFWVLNNGTRNLGKALQFSKERVSLLDRWTYFTLNLLGDPETELVTAIMAPTAHFETRTDLFTPPRIGGLVNLRGTAKRGTANGATFRNFDIEFGQGTNPSVWMTMGIILANNGESEITNATLGVWNTTQVTDGTYTLKLTAYDSGGLSGEDRKIVVVNQNAIPIHIKADGSFDPLTAPIQRDGNLYTLTGNITNESDGIIIERNNMALDGAGYTVLGDGEGVGILMSERSNVTIKNIQVKAHWYGIYLKWSSGNVISGSNITTNNSHGIWLSGSSNNNIVGNNITDNYNGISLTTFSNNNILVGNKIEANYGDYGAGIYVYVSSDNSIYHNAFVNNSKQVYDASWDNSDPCHSSPSINLWDAGYASGGNYWSDYNGTDLYGGPCQNETGSDGVGDTPYIIDLQNQDNYPLMKHYPWAVHDVGITSITASRNIIGQGYNVSINVMVFNYDNATETINITIYANSTTIGEINNINLESRNFKIVSYTWNTSGFVTGNYTIKAAADSVPGEIDITDNMLSDGWILITKVGDIGGDIPPQFFKCDGKVDGKDLSLFLQCYRGLAPQEAMYLSDLGGGVPPKFFKCDEKVDGKDLALFLQCYKGFGP